jgi:hypothetical protein
MMEEAPVDVPLGLLLYLQYASLALFAGGASLDCDSAPIENEISPID